MNDFKLLEFLQTTFGQDNIRLADGKYNMESLHVNATLIKKICSELKNNENTFFDSLSCLTGVDYGAKESTFTVVYNLYSIPFNRHLMLRLEVDKKENELSEVESISDIWATANWQEREIFDLYGIKFLNHPDLRRILLPEDWEGFPLRKDYKEQEKYHGITVKY